jgi:hypothetical protein
MNELNILIQSLFYLASFNHSMPNLQKYLEIFIEFLMELKIKCIVLLSFRDGCGLVS